jgi:hypothetical protein
MIVGGVFSVVDSGVQYLGIASVEAKCVFGADCYTDSGRTASVCDSSCGGKINQMGHQKCESGGAALENLDCNAQKKDCGNYDLCKQSSNCGS